jgi:hypothetical protein
MQQEGYAMAKGQKRGNRETRKPKQPKKAPIAAPAAGSAEPIRAVFATRRAGGGPRS